MTIMGQAFQHWHKALLLGLITLFLMQPLQAQDEVLLEDFVLSTPDTKAPDQLVANVRFDYQLNDYLRESLLNGVTLKQTISFDLMWQSDWLWNTTRTLAKIETELQYHALSEHYQLVRLDTQEHWNFPNLASALEFMAVLQGYKLPKLPPKTLGSGASIVLKALLAPNTPQLPLKLRLLFGDDSAIESQGVMWPLP